MIDSLPFSDISDDELSLVLSNSSSDFNIYDIDLNFCCDTECDTFDFDQDIDPDINCLNNLSVKAKYYTLDNFKDEVCKCEGFSIIHINCRSLNANFSKLQCMIDHLDYPFHVIALSETWLDDNNLQGK